MQRKVGRRNKNYIEQLEKEVWDLKEELKIATHKIAQYKSREHLYQIGNKSGYTNLIKTQENIKAKSAELVHGIKGSPKQYIRYISLK